MADGVFHHYLVEPFSYLIHAIAQFSGGNFGLAIIVLTLVIRAILAPLMLKQFKNQLEMKNKMTILKPELESIQAKIKEAKGTEEQQRLQKEMIALYQRNGVNPLAMGCLPMIIQMPILMGLYYAISGDNDIATHSFLWFNLGHADIILTLIAGMVYYFQFKVSQRLYPEQQRSQMRIFGLLSPVMIVLISFNAPAALPLYWSVGGSFLIGQTWLGQKLYFKKQIAASY